MQNEWIVISEYCDKCHIEPTFIDMLCESGLIDVEQEGGERYLPFSELPDVERYSRMTTTFPSIWKGLMHPPSAGKDGRDAAGDTLAARQAEAARRVLIFLSSL